MYVWKRVARVVGFAVRRRGMTVAIIIAVLLVGPLALTGDGEDFVLNALGLGIEALIVRRLPRFGRGRRHEVGSRTGRRHLERRDDGDGSGEQSEDGDGGAAQAQPRRVGRPGDRGPVRGRGRSLRRGARRERSMRRGGSGRQATWMERWRCSPEWT